MTDTAVRLLPGDQAPDFTLPDSSGHPQALADFLIDWEETQLPEPTQDR